MGDPPSFWSWFGQPAPGRESEWQVLWSWLRQHPAAVDGVLFAIPALLSAVLAVDLAGEWPTPIALVALIMVGVLAFRRTHPVLTTGLVFGLALLHYLAGTRLIPSDVAVLVALYSVAAHGPRWARWLGLVGGLVGALMQGANAVANGSSLTASAVTVVGTAALVVGAWIAGQWRRTRLAYVGSLVDRARRAEQAREQQATIAAAAERARIARELHDIVAHSLSVIIAQADGGRYAAATSPDAAAQALETVATTGRSALRDMRSLLGVLDPSRAGALAPQPDVDTLPELIASVRDSGLAVSYGTVGEPRRLPGGMGLAVYRTVQEALTNTLKHAGPNAAAQVWLIWGPSTLEVGVTDDGRGASAADDGAGRGLDGMAERLAMYGGQVWAGPNPGGGFAVRAVLPLPPEAVPA